jgi:hypothetical protein
LLAYDREQQAYGEIRLGAGVSRPVGVDIGRLTFDARAVVSVVGTRTVTTDRAA